MAKVALVTFGSAGDVHPMLAIGRHLRLRGHQVVLLTNPAFAGDAAKAGLVFRPIGAAQDLQQTVAHPKLWHPVDGFGVMWRYLLGPALEPTYQALAELAGQGFRLVLASPVAMGARVAQEKTGMQLVSVYTAATMLRTVRNPMTMAQWRVPAWAPKPLRRFAWRLLDRHKLQPLVLPALERLRGSLGLAPIKRSVFGHWMHSPVAGVALFPAWFAAAAADWPRQVMQAGFPLYDEDAGLPLPEVPAPGGSLGRFLAAGPPPVVFMPGTAAQGDSAFYLAALRACQATGQRGVLLGPLPDTLAASLPPSVHAQAYAPFAALLPQARALVHHGGVGTCAQALRAGIAQLVLPRAYDQFDNAMRIETLGVGEELRRGDLGRMGERLGRLLASPVVAGACASCALRMRSEDARVTVTGLVESLA